jgi:hypothetical protein
VPSTKFSGKRLEPPILEPFQDQSAKEKAEVGRSPNFHSLGHERINSSLPKVFQQLMCPKKLTPDSKKWGNLGQKYRECRFFHSYNLL